MKLTRPTAGPDHAGVEERRHGSRCGSPCSSWRRPPCRRGLILRSSAGGRRSRRCRPSSCALAVARGMPGGAAATQAGQDAEAEASADHQRRVPPNAVDSANVVISPGYAAAPRSGFNALVHDQAITGSRGRLAQLGEHFPYKEGVTGSSPVPPIAPRRTREDHGDRAPLRGLGSERPRARPRAVAPEGRMVADGLERRSDVSRRGRGASLAIPVRRGAANTSTSRCGRPSCAAIAVPSAASSSTPVERRHLPSRSPGASSWRAASCAAAVPTEAGRRRSGRRDSARSSS